MWFFCLLQPEKKYHLKDETGYALEWCEAINEVRAHYFSGR